LISSIRHVGIVVSDLEKSLFFYKNLLGFSIVKTAQERGPFIDRILALDGVEVTTIKMSALDGTTQLELLRFKSPAPDSCTRHQVNSPGPTHIALTVHDIENLSRYLSLHSVPFLSEPVMSPDGGAKVAFCTDPDGTLIELVEPQKGG
jgi:catechol 2,3-dioxygenase-like lactoylglutathione lyase family enzyme